MRSGEAARIIAAISVATLASCASTPPPPDAPPVIEYAGTPADVRIGQSVVYVLPDGGTLEIEPAGVRTLGTTDWTGDLVILGSDAEGQFVASFMRQGGLPDSCYVENATGIDRGEYIEVRAVLWRKSPAFAPAVAVSRDTVYPPGTRFCLDGEGMVASTVAP